jgi:hypothetical protein
MGMVVKLEEYTHFILFSDFGFCLIAVIHHCSFSLLAITVFVRWSPVTFFIVLFADSPASYFPHPQNYSTLLFSKFWCSVLVVVFAGEVVLGL